ncbi:hypothetical protein GCM10009799_02470 [Nocardiopsis rhodophaea]|uniref:DUF4232 domain-containing protein n=1 Tax=Nocardiopsis rhodophaea TaxID=280238 RepID=A0ABN2S5X7_9ACTN
MSALTRTTRTTRAALVAAAALPALALAAAPASAAEAGGGGGTDHVRSCTNDDIKPIENRRGAAAGTLAVEFGITKIQNGKGPCLMPGWIEVRWVDGFEGEQVGSWARQREAPGEPFVLTMRNTGKFTLFHPNPDNCDPEQCRPTEVAGIEYFLPGDTTGNFGGMGDNMYACANPEVRGTSLSAVTLDYDG